MPSPIIEWTDRVSVITGAARGIGRAAAFALAERGAHVVLADNDEAALDRTRAKLLDTFHKRRITALVTDVTDDADVEMLAAETLDRFGRVDFLMNNAALAIGGRWEHVPLAEWQRSIDVNLMGVTRGLHYFLPAMLRQQSGWIVTTASSCGLFAEMANAGPTVATEAAVIALSKSLALYLAGKGIGVTVLCRELSDAGFAAGADLWAAPGAKTPGAAALGDVGPSEDVVRQMLEGLALGQFLISCSADTSDRLAAWAANPDNELSRLAKVAVSSESSNQ